jgi:LmbE family N-acetylglucosaminyl deacetylase
MINTMLGHTPKTILLVGAHCDDIEIGCGGTVLQLVKKYPSAHFEWVVFSSTPIRAREAEASAARFLADAASQRVTIKQFRNGYFPYVGAEIKDYFEILKTQVSPDMVFTHHLHDRHQDHRTLAEMTWNTFRDHLILEFEIPKYEGELSSPNFFVPITQSQAEKKTSALMECFASEAVKPWFTRDTFLSMLRLRGVESNSPTGLAEGYYCRKLVLA